MSLKFISRRRMPVSMHSDNGTTFVGASRQLSEFYEFLKTAKLQEEIKHFLRKSEITWNFVSPHAPHFDGLWEFAVKSAKNIYTKL